MSDAQKIQKLIEQGRRKEAATALRGLLFLLPFLALIALCGALLVLNRNVINPGFLFALIFPTLLFAWWFGVRPLKAVQNANKRALSFVVEPSNEMKKR